MAYDLIKSKKNNVYILFFLIVQSIPLHADTTLPELPIVIITSSYNNAPWVLKYVDSIAMQEYDNFRVIYIDDCSQDTTVDMIEAYVAWHGLDTKFTLVKNKERKLKLENIYKVIHTCNDTDIILILDGDDWFAHEHVLSTINKKYQEEDSWFVYGQIQFFNDGQLGIGQPIPEEIKENLKFRNLQWIFRHPITFYAWLFKLIRLKDLLTNDVPEHQGKFYPICNDRAMIYPMLEMSQYHVGFIPDVAVIQNRFNPLSLQNAQNQQLAQAPIPSTCWKENRHRPIQHTPLAAPVIDRLVPYVTAKADCVLFSDNNPTGLTPMLDTLHDYVQRMGDVMVIYQADDSSVGLAYKKLALSYPHSTFYNIALDADRILPGINNLKHEHILLLVDTAPLTRPIDCSYAILQMESSFAYAFDIGINARLLDNLDIPYQHIGMGLYAWKFYCDKLHKLPVHHLNGSLYRKKVIIDALTTASWSTIAQLKSTWQSASVDTNNIGLFVDIHKLLIEYYAACVPYMRKLIYQADITLGADH